MVTHAIFLSKTFIFFQHKYICVIFAVVNCKVDVINAADICKVDIINAVSNRKVNTIMERDRL